MLEISRRSKFRQPISGDNASAYQMLQLIGLSHSHAHAALSSSLSFPLSEANSKSNSQSMWCYFCPKWFDINIFMWYSHTRWFPRVPAISVIIQGIEAEFMGTIWGIEKEFIFHVHVINFHNRLVLALALCPWSVLERFPCMTSNWSDSWLINVHKSWFINHDKKD